MENRIIMMIIFFTIFMLIISLSSYVIFSMINKITVKINLKALIKSTFLFNLTFVGIFILTYSFDTYFMVQLHRILSYYLGFLALGVSIALIFWTGYFTLEFIGKNQILTSTISRNIILSSLIVINFLAIYNFEKGINVKKIDLTSNKVSRDYKILQIGDIQYGSVSQAYMESVFQLAIEQSPDFILFVGDLVDFDGYKSTDFDFLNDLKIPIYFINGNHEYYHGLDRISKYLGENKSVKTLINETSQINNEIEVVGIDYTRSEETFSKRLENINLDENKYSILLFHEPKGVEVGLKKGFDLMLYGHTHGGQIFPLTKIVDTMYKYGNGYFKEENTTIYTTTGAGLWGPKMRLRTENEIVLFHLKSDKKKELLKMVECEKSN